MPEKLGLLISHGKVAPRGGGVILAFGDKLGRAHRLRQPALHYPRGFMLTNCFKALLAVAATTLILAGPAQAALIRGEFAGVVLGNGVSHGTINNLSILDFVGDSLTGFLTYESESLIDRNPLFGSSNAQHYVIGPVVPSEISITIGAHTFSFLGHVESAVSVGLNVGGHNWFESLVVASDGTTARVSVENFLGTGVREYVSDVDDISAVNFFEDSTVQSGRSGFFAGIGGDSGNQILYQITSITVGPVSQRVPEPGTLALVTIALAGLGNLRRRHLQSARCGP